MLLVNGEESNIELAPAPCAYSDEIILLWIPLSLSESVRVGAGDCHRRNNQIKYVIISTRMFWDTILRDTFLREKKYFFGYGLMGAKPTRSVERTR